MTPKIIPASDGRHFTLFGDDVRVILSSDDTNGALSLAEQRGQPGSGIPLHVHEREDEVFQAIEGRIEFQIGERTVTTEAGTTVFGPRGVPHSFKIVGTKPARFQVTVVPGGFDKMIDELSRLTTPPTPEILSPICQRYGVKFLPPP